MQWEMKLRRLEQMSRASPASNAEEFRVAGRSPAEVRERILERIFRAMEEVQPGSAARYVAWAVGDAPLGADVSDLARGVRRALRRFYKQDPTALERIVKAVSEPSVPAVRRTDAKH